MAGIPAVISDWDGYRYTVTHGVEGFLIPTLTSPYSHQGEELALQHDFGLLSYQDYVGSVSQHVAVNTDAAASAISRLAADPILRRRMGEAGRQTVAHRFDWPVIARLHKQLYGELSELRTTSQKLSGIEVQHPLRSDPFQDFSSFATESLKPHTSLCLNLSLKESQYRLSNLCTLDQMYGHLHASTDDLLKLLSQLENEGSCSLRHLLAYWRADQHDVIKLSLVWLAKLGFIRWSNSSTDP